MKKIIFLLLLNSAIHGLIIEKYQEDTDKELAINIINNDNRDNYFITVPKHLEPQQRIDFIINVLKMRKDYLYIAKDNGETIGMITLTKRKAPSKRYAEKLKLLGDYYNNFVEMILSDPNLPEQSEHFVLRVSLIVKEDYRKKGYGKKLMSYAETFAKQDSEIQAITLDVHEDNLIALKLYESLGYKKICHNTKIKQISYKLILNTKN
ncbi:MAG: GNAT family N-acetyltransferase [Candidatus Babeliales bacterium]|nr:GNAT family N-acetyltransferase [Candidatus Babeliales bacterium]